MPVLRNKCPYEVLNEALRLYKEKPTFAGHTDDLNEVLHCNLALDSNLFDNLVAAYKRLEFVAPCFRVRVWVTHPQLEWHRAAGRARPTPPCP